MPKLDSTVTTFFVSVALAAGIVGVIDQLQPGRGFPGLVAGSPANAQTVSENRDQSVTSQWAATAPGKVEPAGGIIEIRPEVAGVVTAVHVKTGDRVDAGEILIQLKDDELQARMRAALTEVRIRERERGEDNPSKNAKARLDAEDRVFDAERALHDARRKRDAAWLAKRTGSNETADLKAAQDAVAAAETELTDAQKALDDIVAKDETPLPTRLEGGLQAARSELRVLEIAMERLRIRAPAEGRVLTLDARVGELASASARSPLVRFGGAGPLNVRAEVAERDLANVKVGQSVLIETSAFPGQQFEGTVVQLAPSLSAPKIGGRGPRSQSDVDVVEVMIDVTAQTPLLAGMRVDVYFKPIKTAANTQADG